MNNQTPLVKDNLAAHPAVLAWLRLRADTPKKIDVISDHTKTSIFRLVGIGDHDNSVIAKRCKSQSRAMIERCIYENIPNYLSRVTLHYYGHVIDENNSSWIFTEDAGDGRFSCENNIHTSIAIDWLADLHTSVPKFDTMPNRGLDIYYSYLISAHNRMITNLSNKYLRDVDITSLKSILLSLDYIVKQWDAIYSLYGQLPKGLIHADFKEKNLRVRTDVSGSTLLVFDWEMAGWGLPGVDMWKFNTEDYWLRVKDHWNSSTFETTVQLSRLGKLLWCLSAIEWAAKGLTFEKSIPKDMPRIRIYEERLAEAIQYI